MGIQKARVVIIIATHLGVLRVIMMFAVIRRGKKASTLAVGIIFIVSILRKMQALNSSSTLFGDISDNISNSIRLVSQVAICNISNAKLRVSFSGERIIEEATLHLRRHVFAIQRSTADSAS